MPLDIQPHLPVRLPCYDFTPVTNSTFEKFFFLENFLKKKRITSSIISSHGVTGGVYKARVRVHRSIADLRLLAIPTSCRRVAAYNPNLGNVLRFACFCKLATNCHSHCSTCVAQDVRGMMT